MSVEMISFGSKFIMIKQCCEYFIGMLYKLSMIGIPIYLPAYILGDNQSVLFNTFKPHLSLKNKLSSIAFNFMREGTAKD